MFTGIVEETGVIETLERTGAGVRLGIRSRRCAAGLRVGQSLAVNGCCLTVVAARGPRQRRLILVDLLEETWRRTSFHQAAPGARVNLERAMPARGRFDGHIVTGHVDGTGVISKWEQVGNDWLLEVAAPALVRPHLVYKGSIAIDGISLTVAVVKARHFQVWIIPHTRRVTHLSAAAVGQLVNLECDIVAKYVQRLVDLQQRSARRRR